MDKLYVSLNNTHTALIRVGCGDTYLDTYLDYDEVIVLRSMLDRIFTQMEKKYTFNGEKYTKAELSKLRDQLEIFLGENSE